MSPDQILQHLRYQAARLVFDRADRAEIARLLDALIMQEIYHDKFLPVIEGDDYKPAYKEALSSALRCLNIYFPFTEDEAAFEIIRHHLQTIMSHSIDPFEPLKWLMEDLYWDYDFTGDAFVGDRIGLSDLVGAYWTLDQWIAIPPNPQEVEDLRAEVKQGAAIWLRDWSHRMPNRK